MTTPGRSGPGRRLPVALIAVAVVLVGLLVWGAVASGQWGFILLGGVVALLGAAPWLLRR